MADASDTLKFLMTQFDMAPVGTREEAVMAHELSEVIHMHGLETVKQDFTYPSISKAVFGGAMLVVALAALLSGIHAGPLPLIMLILGVIAAAIFGLEYMGVAVVSRFGADGCSQNLIARHPAAPASSAKKKRTIVVMAHYDTPRADVLATPALRRLIPLANTVCIGAMGVAIVAMLLQVLPLPQVLHSVAYALDIVAAIVLVLGGARIMWHCFFSAHTHGANDNMSAVAAVLGLLDRVRPVNGDEIPRVLASMRQAEEDALAGVGDTQVRGGEQPEARPAAVFDAAEEEARSRRARRAARLANAPVRRGADVLRSLGMVPASCEIEYEAVPSADETALVASPVVSAPASEAPVAAVEPAPASEEPAAPAPSATVVLAREQIEGAVAQKQEGVSPAEQAEDPARPFTVITSDDEPDAELRHPAAALPRDVAQQQGTLLDDEEIRRESILNNPAWGTTSFTPVRQNRVILEDVPDPSVAAVDPYSVSSIETIGDYNPEDFSAMDFETGTHSAVTPAMLEDFRRRNESGFMNLSDDGSKKRGKRANRGRTVRNSQRAAQMAAEMQEQSFTDWLGVDEGFDARTSGQQIGSWQNFENDAVVDPGAPQPGADGFYPDGSASDEDTSTGRRWQGGAARARRPREEVHDTPVDRDDADLRQAAMQLGDHDLVSHEIWFVLTGASEAGHAGVKAFLSEYASRLRGAYFINLECVGAGRQSIVVEEGRVNHSKPDRRLVNLFGAASTQIGRPLAMARMGWRDTEVTPLLRQGMRGVTICGLDGDVPARACSMRDTADEVNANKVRDIVDIMVEVIKRA